MKPCLAELLFCLINSNIVRTEFWSWEICLDCPVGLVAASATDERGVLGSISRSGKKCY